MIRAESEWPKNFPPHVNYVVTLPEKLTVEDYYHYE